MMKIVFATNNAHKLEEIKRIVGKHIEILSLKDIGCYDDIEETADTLEGNAQIKARYIWERYGFNCFADDTGLEVDALNGEPGVRSARYAEGKGHDSEANMSKLLQKLEGVENRKACFRTVIALMLNEEEYFFEGRIDGHISTQRMGQEGFGYDPIFIPEGYDKSFAQLGADIKNQISHRAKAVQQLIAFLQAFQQQLNL